jgi:uncharacterized membrane protein HdeD (DUF308 family)
MPDTDTPAAATTAVDGVPAGLARIGAHPGLLIATGLLSVVIGVLVLVWPAPTAGVLAVLFAIQLGVGGVLQLVAAFAVHHSGGQRALLALVGALLIVVALLCLRAPLQTAVVLGLLLGASWVVSGIIAVFVAIGAGRGWGIVSGLLYMIGGAVVLVYPGISVVGLTWMFGLLLVITGIVVAVDGFRGRRERVGRRGPAAVSATA